MGYKKYCQPAEQSKLLFSSRKQTISQNISSDDNLSVEISFEAVMDTNLPNGIKAGDEIKLAGRSEFAFLDGKISKITDIS